MSCGILIVLGTVYGLFQENSIDFAEEALEIKGSRLDRIMTLCILPDFPSSRCYIVERQFHFSLYSLLTLGVTLDLEKIKTLIVTRAFTL